MHRSGCTKGSVKVKVEVKVKIGVRTSGVSDFYQRKAKSQHVALSSNFARKETRVDVWLGSVLRYTSHGDAKE